ncbi:MAG TPA: FliM/FliN family flagellar motor switch protein [Polyangiaceae bacterium]
MTRDWLPYPWDALERVPRAAERDARNSSRTLRALLDPKRIAQALSEILEAPVSLLTKSISARARREDLDAGLILALGAGATCELRFAPELAVDLLTRALRRPFRLTAPSSLEEALLGALGALAVETARRAGCEAPRLLLPEAASNRQLTMEFTLLVDGKPYLVLAGLSAPLDLAPQTTKLAALAELPVSLPLVGALGLTDRATFRDFEIGNAWFPGAGWWIDPAGKGKVALAAPDSDSGTLAELTASGDLMLRGETIHLAPETGEPMSETKDQPLSQAVLDSPLVVRVELGAVTLTAREWSELGPGDIIAAGRRVAEPVVLRVAGREVARGELVNLEGELGVRIRELVRA